MNISSARPDALDHAARGFGVSNERLHEAARAVWRAADAYADHCTAAPVDLASPSRAGAVVSDARDLVGDLGHLATAFRTADSGSLPANGGPGVTLLTDLALSSTILSNHPSLGRELTGPSLDQYRRATALAESIAREHLTGGAERAMERLAAVPDAIRSDPIFAAGLINALGPERLEALAEELTFRAVGWPSDFGPLMELARLWTDATRSLDLPPRAPRLDLGLIDSLLASAGGRNLLRALTGGSDEPAGERFLLRTLHVLIPAAVRDEDLSNTYRFLLGSSRQGNPDAPLLAVIGRNPGILVESFLRGRHGLVTVEELEARTRTLLDAADHASQALVAELLAGVLADPRIGSDPHDRDRTAILRTVYEWVDDNGPGSVAEPLAALLAGTLATDIDFYLARVDTARRGDLARVLQAVTQFERPWMTAILALEHHGARLVQETLHRPAAEKLVALAELSRLEDAFEDAAEASDAPVDRSGWGFTAFSFVVTTGLGLIKLKPVASIVARPLAQAALDELHESLVGDPGDVEAQTRLARESLRRRIWAVIASDPELGRQVDWSVGGTGSDRHDGLGSTINSVDDLMALTRTEADIDELAGWADGQPAHLQAMVDAYMAGAT